MNIKPLSSHLRVSTKGKQTPFKTASPLVKRVANNLIPSLIVAWVLLMLVLAVPVSGQDSGQGSVSADQVNDIAKKMYCPVCENIPLDVCGTTACEQWRDEIRIQLEEGRSEDQIIADFVNRYGDRVVGTPQDPFLRSLSLVTPWLIGALMLAGVVVLLTRWLRRDDAGISLSIVANSAANLSDDDYRARLEADLKARR